MDSTVIETLQLGKWNLHLPFSSIVVIGYYYYYGQTFAQDYNSLPPSLSIYLSQHGNFVGKKTPHAYVIFLLFLFAFPLA